MAISRQRFLFTALPAGDHVFYIDLAKTLSVQERKLHRQFMNYHVRGGLLKDSNQDAVIRCNVAPDTWVTRTALRRGKRMYDQCYKEGMQGTGDIRGKYWDYKVLLDEGHTPSASIVPKDAAGNSLPVGEWVYSEYVSEDVDWSASGLTSNANRTADKFRAHISGRHLGSATDWTSIGLITSWFESRPTPKSDVPQVAAAVISDPLANLFDESDADDDKMAVMQVANDEPPYDEDSHFGMLGSLSGTGQNLQRVAFAATQSGAGQISALNPFSALCGLVQVHITVSSGPGDVELILDVESKGDKI
jgi:hypothetical protein